MGWVMKWRVKRLTEINKSATKDPCYHFHKYMIIQKYFDFQRTILYFLRVKWIQDPSKHISYVVNLDWAAHSEDMSMTYNFG
jgi:hypothetical protein